VKRKNAMWTALGVWLIVIALGINIYDQTAESKLKASA
jgi:hypothetical protein